MRFGSVCSGIEAASVAWHPLGWRASFLSEIEPFPCSALQHHYPEVPLHGDFTTIKKGQYDAIDVLVGGTPCQSFSVAGLRKGLDDPRGNLMLGYLALADKYRPDWLVWENVPGVLSSNGGRDFGTFLGGLGQLGYGFAYRVLDAQHFGVPQRRRRVFVVGCLGDWRRAAAVLFERHSLQGNNPPRRQTGQNITGAITRSAFSGGASGRPEGAAAGHFLPVAYGGNNTSGPIEVATALNACASASGQMDFESETFIAHTLRGEGFDASEDGTGRGTPLVPISWSEELTASVDLAGTIQRGGNGGRHDGVMTASSRVRRLTPRECERLQGFPDDYTLVPHRGKPAADGPRYKALGNSMAVPVMAWIGQRIEAVAQLSALNKEAA